ncbi:MAG: type IV pilus secretin PilQ [Cellvibrionaceae bacterium]
MLSNLKWMKKAFFPVCAVAAMLGAQLTFANSIEDISFSTLPGDRFEVKLEFSESALTPEDYAIEQPARIVLDFVGIDNGLSEKRFPLSMANAQSAMVLEGDNRTRLIVNLDQLTGYQMRSEGNAFFLEVGQGASGGVASSVSTAVSSSSSNTSSSSKPSFGRSGNGITNIDFRRGDAGEGKVIISLANPNTNIDMQEVRGAIELTFDGTTLPGNLANRYDVNDFATPVKLVDAESRRNGAVVRIEAAGEYDYLAYQTDTDYIVSVKPLTAQEIEAKAKEFAYVGDRISLNFQDIPIRSVLQIIADMTDLNLVASDTVTGNIALRLDNVPWDQALELVLKTKGLDERRIGNVLMVAPAAEIAERERQELETLKQLEELAPLRTEYIRIRYANARELFELFDDASGAGSGGGAGGGQGNSTGSILSERGQAIVDERTNSIILTDTQEKINQFRALVEQIDVPIRQVMIEARIVIANTDFREEIGIRWAADGARTSGSNKYEATGRLEGLTVGDGSGPESLFIDSDGDGVTDDERSLLDSTVVDLGIANAAGNFTWNVISDTFLLGMELSALEDSGNAEIVSQPKVITGDKQEAEIVSGTEIPYQEASASGATSTSFKEAVLKLNVTPQITPDNNIIMDLDISQDSVGAIDVASGIPTIDITQIQTQVLVANGETVVLGGIYQTEQQTGVTKVPFLGDIPYLGRLFRQDVQRESKRELLIFITPKVLSETLVQ